MPILDSLFFTLRWGALSRRQALKILFLSEPNEIAQAQVFPFFHNKHLLRKRGIEIRESRIMGSYPDADIVCFQTWFDLTPEQIGAHAQRIQATYPSAKLIYLDWFAPLDLRYAEALEPHILFYVKKQIFSDFNQYGEPTLGDTNLSDYYSQRFHISAPKTRFNVPPGLKVVLSPNFDLSRPIVNILKSRLNTGARDIDVHARIASAGTDWYSAMRGEAINAAAALVTEFKVTPPGRVGRKTYLAELRRSKTCFSPFGYGEICWRDFEAMATGSLLLKPDISHLKLYRNYFRPYETYIPLRWDLSDLKEKVAHYVSSVDERTSIAESALNELKVGITSDAFLNSYFLRNIQAARR